MKEVDFEENSVYSMEIEAKDKGSPPLSGHCTILIEILDVNDNAAAILLKSMVIPLPDDSPPGTLVALIIISDRDSESNRQVSCFLWPPQGYHSKLRPFSRITWLSLWIEKKLQNLDCW